LLLGYLEPGEFLGGRRRLDAAPARDAADRLAGRLGTSSEQALVRAQAAIRDTLSEHLLRWAQRHPALTTAAPADRWLLSYGGGGGLLCTDAAEILGIGQVVVFPHSSVFSAFGAGLLPIAHSYHQVVAAGARDGALGAAVARLADNARRDLRAEGVRELDHVRASLRIGAGEPQEHSLAALLEQPPNLSQANGAAAMGCRLHVSVPRSTDVEMHTAAESASQLDGQRVIITADGPLQVPTANGLGNRGAAAAIAGPVFLNAPDTTIFVPANWSVTFTDQGYGVLNREQAT
jgi:N-methylhydantoinase A/oxoprolinase/acetone carboxylase beta subunit